MNFGGPTGTGVASAVWAASTRRLTGLTGVMAVAVAANTTLAAAATLDLRANSNTSRDITVIFNIANLAGAAGSIQLWDGTTAYAASIGALLVGAQANTMMAAFIATTASIGARLNNTGTQTNNYEYAYREWSL